MINGKHWPGLPADGTAALGGGPRPTVVVSTVASDSHTWNLVYLQLLLEEFGFDVVNLGACVPDDVLVSECREIDPRMIVISSVNGHGHQDGRRVIQQLRACPELAATPVVIGGKLGVAGGDGVSHSTELLDAGFDAVFEDGVAGPADFAGFVNALSDSTTRSAVAELPSKVPV